MAAFSGKVNWGESFKEFLLFKNISDPKTRADVNVILDQLNADQSFPCFAPPDQNDILAFFNQGCTLITVEKSNHFLLLKFFQVVEKILIKHKVVFDDETLNNLVGHVITSANICQSASIYDHLRILGAVLYENGAKCDKFCEALLGVQPAGLLVRYCDRRNNDLELQKIAITCIGNICMRDANGSNINERFSEVALLTVLNVLQNPPRKDVIKIDQCKVIHTSLKTLQDILPSLKPQLKHHLGQLLLTIKNYMYYGFPGYELTFPNRPSDVSPRDSSSDLEPDDLCALKLSLSPEKERTFPGRGALKKRKSRQKRGKAAKDDKNDEEQKVSARTNNATYQRNRRPAQNSGQVVRQNDNSAEMTNIPMVTVPSWRDGGPLEADHVTWSANYSSSSESEFSDTESGQACRLRAATTKVRNCSLVCLQTVIKNCDKKDLYGFWSSFISDGSGALSWSLFTIIQNDTDFKNRTGAAAVLMDILDGSKQFLSAADDSDRHQTSTPRPFTSFSSRLGSIIYELHRLLDLIPAETSSNTQVQLLKCTAVLVLNCPYRKLQPGLLTKVYETMRPLLSHKDLAVRQSVLVCLGAMLTVDTSSDEVLSILENKITVPPPGATAPPSPHPPAMPFLLHECREILQCSDPVLRATDAKDESIHLRSEALHLLIVFVRKYFNLLRPWLAQLSTMTQECLKDSNRIIQVNCIKLLQEIGRMMHETLYTEDETEQKNIVQQFWREVLSGELVNILQSHDALSSKCRAAACDCLSDIGGNVYEEMPFNKRILVVTVLLGLTNEADSYVKAASIRALGVYIMYPLLREDVAFVTDAATAVLKALTDTALLVRMRCAWSLANLSDALVINKNCRQSTFKDDFSETLFLRLINESSKASEDSDKVKCNIVRSLGNFAKYLSEHDLGKKCFCEAYEKIVTVITACILTGLMKTRWNACYAAGNVFSNQALTTTSVTLPMFDALLSVASTCKNFKVRINAVNALAVPATRSCYGNQFVKVWRALVDTLIATNTISDFSEFRYRDTLRQQITAALCHLTCLTTVADMHSLQSFISEHCESLKEYISMFYQNKMKPTTVDSEVHHGTTTDNSAGAQLFLRAHDHVLAMKEPCFAPIQTVFAEARKVSEALLQAMFETTETD